MQKIFFLLFFSILLISKGAHCGNDSISITNIANCGFLIKIDSQKIIVDGLFKYGHNRYYTPDAETQKLLVSNQAPFNDIDLILVSHTHEDHFERDMVIECMLNNPSVKLMCPQQVIDVLRENEADFEKIKSRINECTPEPYTSVLEHIGNIEVQACRFAHPGERHKGVQNIAYLITVNGKSVFHSADIDPAQIDKYTGIKINEQNIDVGLINEDFAKVENGALTREYINAKYNVAMHLQEAAANVWLDSFRDQQDLFPNPYIFRRELENKVFYIK